MTADAVEINRLLQYHLQNATQFDSHNSALRCLFDSAHKFALRYVCLILTTLPYVMSAVILTTLPYIMSAFSGVFTPDAENVTVLATLIRMIKLIWSKNKKYNNKQQYSRASPPIQFRNTQADPLTHRGVQYDRSDESPDQSVLIRQPATVSNVRISIQKLQDKWCKALQFGLRLFYVCGPDS